MKNDGKLIEILKIVAPGTEIRKGLDNIVHASKGALIVIGDTPDIISLIDGGFYINCEYTPEKIYELAKMDGAIILSHDMQTILYANVHMQPDSHIKTNESGTRHRTAQRVARQTGKLVIAISERKKLVSFYTEDMRYTLRNIPDVIGEANQAVKTLERYNTVLDKILTNLTIMEFDDLVTLYEICISVQRFEMLFRIAEEVRKYIVELGSEGRLINMQFEEIILGTDEEYQNLIKDYFNEKAVETIDSVIVSISNLSQEELLDPENIAFCLGYEKSYDSLDNKISPRGFRVLGKILKLTRKDIEKLVEYFGELNRTIEAPIEDFYEIKGINKFKAKSIKNSLNRLKMTAMLEK